LTFGSVVTLVFWIIVSTVVDRPALTLQILDSLRLKVTLAVLAVWS